MWGRKIKQQYITNLRTVQYPEQSKLSQVLAIIGGGGGTEAMEEKARWRREEGGEGRGKETVGEGEGWGREENREEEGGGEMTQSPTAEPVAALTANSVICDLRCCEMPSRARTGTTTVKPGSVEPGQGFHSGRMELNVEASPAPGRTNA